MARFSRLAGAIIFEGSTGCYLIGHTKEPCSFETYGFHPQDPLRDPAAAIERLVALEGSSIAWPTTNVTFNVDDKDDEVILMKLGEVFLISRNNMVSERIWNLITEECGRTMPIQSGQWILESPDLVWDIVRDTLLRC